MELLDEIERKQREANPLQPITVSKPAPIKNTVTPTYGVDAKVKHNLFGIGTVIAFLYHIRS